MKKIILFLGLALMAHDVLGGAGLKIRFALSLDIGTSFFMQVPHTSELCEEYEWITYTPPKKDREGLDLKCASDDVTVCVYINDIGKAAGVQVSIDPDMMEDVAYSYEDQGYTSWTVNVNGTSKTLWSISHYFVSNAYQALSTDERLADYDDSTLLQEGSVWFTGWGEELEVSATQTGFLEAGFTQQSCIFWMGHHYFYNMTSDTVCSANTIYPFFLLMRSDKFFGCGLNVIGTYKGSTTARDWFETPSASDVEMIVSSGPDCLYDLASSPGVMTIHIYFEDDPYLTTCILQ